MCVCGGRNANNNIQCVCVCAGEDVYVQLHGTAADVNVRLDKSSLMMEDTYLGLTTQR